MSRPPSTQLSEATSTAHGVGRLTQYWQRGSLALHLVVRLMPPIALLVALDLTVTWVLTRKMSIEEWVLRDIFWTMVLTQITLVALFAWVLVRGLRSGLASIHDLSEQINEREVDELQALDPSGLPTELLPLTTHFNDLLLRLDDTLQAQKRFIGHAAHQFRTPLSSLRLESELMLAQDLSDDTRARAERIKLISDRMIRLGEQLLVLARADASVSPSDSFVRLDLCEWTRSVGAEWIPAARAQAVSLQLIAPESPVWIDANPVLLQELLANLIDNALRYGAQGKVITLGITNNPPSVAIEDEGIGISIDDSTRVFDAFYRSSDTQQSVNSGSGLGLAIVHEIARLHGAWITLKSRPEVNGTRISVVFPGPRIGTHLKRQRST